MNLPQPVTSPRIGRPKLFAVWLLAAGLGVALGFATAQTGGAGLGYLAMLAMVLGLPLIARTRLRRLAASGLLVGFAGLMLLGFPEGPADCGNLLNTCAPTARVAWPFITAVALLEALSLLIWASGRDRARPRASELERTLGIVSGASEAEAWQKLASISAAWRNDNDKQVSLWWGGGSV